MMKRNSKSLFIERRGQGLQKDLRNIHLLVFNSARSIAGQALQPLGSLFSFSGKPVGFLLAFREWGPYKLQKQWWSAHFRGSGQPAQYDLPKH